MSEKRFTLTDLHEVKDNGKIMTVDEVINMLNEQQATINDKEKMVKSLNDDIKRLHTAIDEYGIDIKNLHNRLRKQERISNTYNEITQLLIELIGEIE